MCLIPILINVSNKEVSRLGKLEETETKQATDPSGILTANDFPYNMKFKQVSTSRKSVCQH